jgi:hypothetical protein
MDVFPFRPKKIISLNIHGVIRDWTLRSQMQPVVERHNLSDCGLAEIKESRRALAGRNSYSSPQR